MIRFVDLTEAYWTDGGPPVCAFLDTRTNRFIGDDCGVHVFSDVAEMEYIIGGMASRCLALVPDRFFVRPAEDRDGPLG